MRFERWKKLWDFPLKGKECMYISGGIFLFQSVFTVPIWAPEVPFSVCPKLRLMLFLLNNDNSGKNSDDDDYDEKQRLWVEAHILTVVQLSGLPRLLQRLCRVRSGLSLLSCHMIHIIIREYHTIVMWISYDYMTWLIIDYAYDMTIWYDMITIWS